VVEGRRREGEAVVEEDGRGRMWEEEAERSLLEREGRTEREREWR
jgi:hypothetical protein